MKPSYKPALDRFADVGDFDVCAGVEVGDGAGGALKLAALARDSFALRRRPRVPPRRRVG